MGNNITKQDIIEYYEDKLVFIHTELKTTNIGFVKHALKIKQNCYREFITNLNKLT